ncbi:MAG: archaeosine biosynthesis radical SAM protein RaSEA [Thermoplasmatota archaeon]
MSGPTPVAAPAPEEPTGFTRREFFRPIAKASRVARKLEIKSGDASYPSTVFVQPDRLENRAVQAFVVILRTRGCRWALGGGCTFCGYVNDSFIRKIEPAELVQQFDRALERYHGEPILKIYTSGSFFDPYEVGDDAQVAIASRIPRTVEKLNVEAQAPDVTLDRVAAVVAALAARPAATVAGVGETHLEVGVGIEAAHAEVARFSVNKEFFLPDFVQASAVAAKAGASLKAYTMVKPPFLTEREALEEAVETARLTGPHASTVSLNPTNIQKHTLVEDLWKRAEYRPPWLWTVIEALKRSRAIIPAATAVKSDPVGGGMVRGAHNCGRCDDHALRAIQAFNVSQDVAVFDDVRCSCRERWADVLDLEAFYQGPLAPDPRDVIRAADA